MTLLDIDEILLKCKLSAVVHVSHRPVYVVIFHQPSSVRKGSFFNGWEPSRLGHWGLLVNDMLYHMVYRMNDERERVGAEFRIESWVDEGEQGDALVRQIGITSLGLGAVIAIGTQLTAAFGSHSNIQQNSSIFAKLLTKLVCNVEYNEADAEELSSQIDSTLFAFPTVDDPFTKNSLNSSFQQKTSEGSHLAQETDKWSEFSLTNWFRNLLRG
ncbi:hypothetical protein BKA69DRAFT_1068445 [Paraphysoderma sedebokerense]|nr:hypothetical protein BKA69DRAFT_1068445 [Paraphysoderma sedebokerense]